jgi:transcriptional regulator with XRE-family HTH domain
LLLSRQSTASLPALKGDPRPYRKRLTISQEELAAAAGVHEQTLRELVSCLEEMIAKDRAEGVTKYLK